MKTFLLKKFKSLSLLLLIVTNYSIAQQIDVYGSGSLINDGGVGTPSITNHTNFGSTNESGGTVTKTFTIVNSALLTNLTIGSFTFAGTNSADFTLTKAPSSPVGPLGGSTTFEVTFNPSALGNRTATISFVTNVSGKNPYNFNISGTGVSYPTQSHTLYYENFDNNDGSWVTSGSGTSNWVWTNTLHRGEGSFWRVNTPASTYSGNLNINLTSPIISTAGYKNIKIALDARYDTNNDTDDGMQMQYSTNGGTTWLVLGTTTENWYNATNVASMSASLGSTTGWNGENVVIAAPYVHFEEKSMQNNALDNLASLRFRVVFTSDGGSSDAGTAIDNIIIKGDPIVAFSDPVVGPGSINGNLKLWLKSTAGTSTTTDGTALNSWNDQAFDNNATGIGTTKPTYRDGASRNVNYNPAIDFSAAASNTMKGKGGYWAQDYYVVVKTNGTVNNLAAARQVPISGRTAITTFHLDGTAFAVGNFTARYANEMVSHSINSVPQAASTNSYGRAYTSTTDSYVQETIIYNIKTNTAGNSTEIYKNGKRIDNTAGQSVAADQVTFTGLLNFSEFSNLQYNLGTGRFSLNGNIGSYLDGRLTEIASYATPKSALEQQKIQSYLGIKNGITLHASASVTATNLNDVDYVDSSGNVIWNTVANNGFDYDIAGIGRDDNTQLNQKQSKSENPGTVLTIGLGDVLATNSANTNTFATDRNFLIWGSNGLPMTDSGVNLNIDLGPTTITTITEVVSQRWKVVEVNGDVATTRVSIPTAAFVSGLPALGPTDAYVMVVATNAAFTTGVETVFMSTTGSNETCLYDFDGTKYITFGVAHQATNPLHITLDGFDDFVKIADANEVGSNFTVMTWIRPNGANTLGTERTILAKKASAASGYQLVLQNDNRIRMEWSVAGTTFSAVTNTAIPETKWHNIAVTYGATTLTLYIDGVQDKSTTIAVAPITSTSNFSIGGQYVDKNNINNLFKGDIDELRMWSRVLSPTEIRFIMNQEISQNGTGTKGTIIPTTVTKNDISTLLWSNLFAYYSMNSYIGTHLDDDSVNINRGSLVIPDKISINPQTAPMPYVSLANGSWASDGTWTNGTIQDLPYSLSIIDGVTPIDWNIVRTTHNIDSSGNKVLLGAFVNSNTLTASNDSKVEVSHYLKLNGKIDLQGRSQLVQTLNSDLDPTSAGSIEKDQQGTKNIYNYNYWSSPVGAINNTTNNNAYTVAGVMKDGTTSTPQNITWTTGVNGSPTSPITLSSYWIFKFQNLTNAYANWQSVGSGGSLNAAQGFTLKGSGTASANQNYTFVGKPNNGQITTTVASGNLNLSGNPYASALDANAFITANSASTTGSLYFWEHSSTNNTHNLVAYQGGYSVRNLVGGTPPTAPAGISGVGSSVKVPGRYVPVSQGFFFVGSAAGGTVTFNNNQRAFIKEDNVNSTTLFRNSNANNMLSVNHFTNNEDDAVTEDSFTRVRLGLTSKDNYHRQILLGFMEQNATSGLDYGYDANNIDNQLNDVYFRTGGANLAIQGDGYFNANNVYPIGIKTNVFGEVKLMVDATENLNNNQRIFILDNLDGVYHEITNNEYIVELPQGLTENRFSLTFKDTNVALSNAGFDLTNGINIAYANQTNILNIKNNVVDTTVEQVLLFNMLGQQVKSFETKDQSQQNIQLPIKGISSGTYIVKIRTDKGDTTRKIVFN